MATSFTVKLPDGNEYGPVDLATLRSWHDEGRIGPDTWVWPEGSPEWLTLIDVLAGAGQEAPGGEAPLRFKEEVKPHPTPRVDARRPTGGIPKGAPGGLPKAALASLAGLLALGLSAFAYFVLLPRLSPDRGRLPVGDGLPDRRFADAGGVVAVELPEGWVLLRPDSTLFTAPQAAARFAHPASGAMAALNLESIPPGVLSPDAFLDRAVDHRRALFTDYREGGRSDLQIGGRPGRRLQASWKESGVEHRVTAVAVQDAWSYGALSVFAPVRSGPAGAEAAEALLQGFRPSGVLEGRVAEAAAALAPELPELSLASLALIVRDRLGSGGTLEEVRDASVRAVSQGLPALSAPEAEEMRQVYAQVYDPMPEDQRQRLAAWQREVRAGRTAAEAESAELRPLLRDALLALPPEARTRLQELNEKAIAAAYALR